jgi:4-amino-4-deoxy-L-arabinose transferase-like glycosyltransferase
MSDMPTPAPFWPRPLLTILAAGFALRLVLWVGFVGVEPRIADEKDYVELGRQIAVTGEYAYRPGVPTSLRPPLYPAMIAAVYAVAGVDNFSAVRLTQAVLSLGICVLMYNLGRLVYGPRAGLWAAGLFAFYPTFLGYNNLILTEVLFTFWTVAGALATVWALRRDDPRGLVAAGVLLALGALTRSILYPFAPILGLFLLVTWRGGAARRALAVLAFAVPFAAVLTPWAVRNTRVHQVFIPVDCMGGRNFMMGNYEHTPMYRSWDAISITGDREWIAVLKARHPGEWTATTQGQVDQLAMKQAVRFIFEQPGLTARRDAIKFFDFWGLDRELIAATKLGHFGPVPLPALCALAVAVCGSYVFVLFAGAFGAATRPPTDGRVHAFVLLLIAFVCGVHTLVFAHSRYHVPVMPFVMLYAAAALTMPPATGPRYRAGRWLAVGFCVLIAFGWCWNLLAGDWNKVFTALGLSN